MRLVWTLRESGDASQPVNLLIAYPSLDLECPRAVSVMMAALKAVLGSQALRVDIIPGVLLFGFYSNKQTNKQTNKVLDK